MTLICKALIWGGFFGLVGFALLAALSSPLLAWREPIYILAGLVGVIGLALLLIQPALAAGFLPGLPFGTGRRLHRWVGGALLLSIVVHVIGLWITSPPDMVDALLFASPTPFSAWGVIAMWALFAAALLATLRRRFRSRLRLWRRAHTGLACVTVLGSVLHAILIEGTMETVSKIALCVLVLLATGAAIVHLRSWAPGNDRRTFRDVASRSNQP